MLEVDVLKNILCYLWLRWKNSYPKTECPSKTIWLYFFCGKAESPGGSLTYESGTVSQVWCHHVSSMTSNLV